MVKTGAGKETSLTSVVVRTLAPCLTRHIDGGNGSSAREQDMRRSLVTIGAGR